jgi:hypothetical protein
MIDVRIRPEARLKAAVIDKLYLSSHVDRDAVLVSEMVVDNWSRRADVVLANGKLWCFEIKSEMDSLSRLPGQIDTFARSFEKLVIVVARKFEEAARVLLPEGVGLWVEDADGALKERVRPRVMALSKEAAITAMTAAELRRLLACNGTAPAGDAQRAQLSQLAACLPASDLANAARDAIKKRHRARHAVFEERRMKDGTMAALSALRRPPARSSRPSHAELAPSQIVRDHSHEIGWDNPALYLAPAGPVLRRLSG